MKKNNNIYTLIISASAILSVILLLRYFGIYLLISLLNLWGILNDQQTYYIPKESSIFDFGPIITNSGSGGGWIYGTDSKYVYYAHPDSAIGTYLFIEKSFLSQQGSIDTVFESWPKEKVMSNTINPK
jgi:hypothetical protein